jgi:hypothetical protein
MGTKIDWRTVNKYIVIGGSSVIVVSSAIQLFDAKTLRGAVMPIVTILIGASAFTYAMNK